MKTFTKDTGYIHLVKEPSSQLQVQENMLYYFLLTFLETGRISLSRAGAAPYPLGAAPPDRHLPPAQRRSSRSAPPISSPPYCGKTSLLFQFAINRAAESGRSVVFICRKGRLENSPPFLAQGVDPSHNVFHRIQIKYELSLPFAGWLGQQMLYCALFVILDPTPNLKMLGLLQE
ncbi:hypothetical protein GUJ93_ZPchr0002g24972 [Zizania palustris]|uniref:Uncharacterized protein n=1 Tax=Zizania palustris TaxID=103762 RepID=A0A8J5SR39_ZIZPA|nr:hypothetical protein GUJ93_ZPchr0002g24972 [Zizania palustris]KAG8060937.1 hypothetical protein GUJ93_ZPchr0002g24972 [Zizania palustris]